MATSRFHVLIAIVISLFGTALCHDENVEILEELEETIQSIEDGQINIILGIEALHESLNEQVEESDNDEESRDQTKEATEPEDPMSNAKVKNFVDRLNKLEENIEAVQSYIGSERETDEFLRGLSGDIGDHFDNDMLQVKKLSADMKAELKNSLQPVNHDLTEVEDIANSRNVIIGGVLYYDGIGSACGSSFDVCRVEDSECRDGKCQCAPGLSHDSLHESCVDTCEDGYGYTYQTVHNYIIRGYISATMNETSLSECKEHCQTEDSFICRSFDYFPRWKACYLSENVKGDTEDAWEYNSAGIHFQRDCIVDKE